MESLTQKKLFLNRRKYEIKGSQLKISHKNLGGNSQESFDLFDIDPDYNQYQNRPFKWLIFLVIFLAPGTLFVYSAIQTENYPLLGGAAFFAIPVLFCLFAFIHKSSNVSIFRNRHSGQFAFWNNNPSKSASTDFLITLQKKIQSLYINPKVNAEDKLVLLGKYLEVFLNEEILSEAEAKEFYDRARKKLRIDKNATILSIVE